MNNPMVLTASVFIGVLSVVLLVSTLVNRGSALRRRRLDDHTVGIRIKEPKRLERHSVLKEYNFSSIGLLNTILRRLKPAQTAAVELLRANSPVTVTQYLLGRILLAAAAFFVVNAVTGVLLFAIPIAPVVLMLPRVMLVVLAKRRLKAFEGQLAEAIDLMVGALRAGYGFLQSIDAVSSEMPNPTREEFGKVLEQVNVGTTPTAALAHLAERIASYDLDMFVTAVTVQRNVGGNLAEVLENIAETVRERRRIRAEVQALTTGPRVSSYILGLFPIGLAAFFMLTDDNYRQIMTSELIGKIMLGGAFVWSLIGFALSTTVSKVEY